MSLGKIARSVLGPKLFAIVARYYRLIFVDLEKVAAVIAEVLPQNAHLVDIGGGDGETINHLARLRKDVRITMIDISENVGNSIHPDLKQQVNFLPKTSVREFNERYDEAFDAILISDVIHHIPEDVRINFFNDIFSLCAMNHKPVIIIVKDIETKGFISFLGYLSDRYVSNDKLVKFVSQKELIVLLAHVFPKSEFHDTRLSTINYPNYAFYFKIGNSD